MLIRCVCVFLAAMFPAPVHVPQVKAAWKTQSKVRSADSVSSSAQTMFIRTKSVYFKPAALEQALLERDGFQQSGFIISRDEADADLILEVDRKLFTNRFVYSLIEVRTRRVLLGGKIGSLGGSVESQIADGLLNKLRRFRRSASVQAK